VHDIIEECLAIDAGDPKNHLGLKVDEDNGRVPGVEQFRFHRYIPPYGAL